MKKIIILILVSILTVLSCIGITENCSPISPTLKILYNFKPSIEFDFLDSSLTNLDLEYQNPFDILTDCYSELELEYYHLDEAFILYLNKEYNLVEVIFPLCYNLKTAIYAIFITEEEIEFVRQGTITESGSILFDFTFIPPEQCIMFIITNERL